MGKLFTRALDEKIIKKIKGEKLFSLLLRDIKEGTVFPAIRDNKIHFYHKGGRLFEYSEAGWVTNVFYISADRDGEKWGDFNQKSLPELAKNFTEKSTFAERYENIKRHCADWNKQSESSEVSVLYDAHSYVASSNNIVVLDIESVFSSNSEEQVTDSSKKTDRIDMILFDKKNGVLQAVEAKLYENGELRGPVVNQINRYQKNIEKRKCEIVEAYNNYRDIVNNLFGLELRPVKGINKNVKLLCFGFDEPNRISPKFKKIKSNLEEKLNKKNVRFIGSAKSLKKLESLI